MININKKRHNKTALIIACERGYYEIVNLIFEYNQNYKNNNNNNILDVNISFDYKVVNFNIKQYTALGIALENHHYKIVELFFEYNKSNKLFDINNFRSYSSDDPYSLVIFNKDPKNAIKVIKLLIENGVSFDTINQCKASDIANLGNSNKYSEILELMMAHGFNLAVNNKFLYMHLIIKSMVSNSTDIIDILMKYNVINEKSVVLIFEYISRNFSPGNKDTQKIFEGINYCVTLKKLIILNDMLITNALIHCENEIFRKILINCDEIDIAFINLHNELLKKHYHKKDNIKSLLHKYFEHTTKILKYNIPDITKVVTKTTLNFIGILVNYEDDDYLVSVFENHLELLNDSRIIEIIAKNNLNKLPYLFYKKYLQIEHQIGIPCLINIIASYV